ncbi:helix-turn-helix domain-containing protein [Micromonospora sp. NPDC023633]|uniref:helix-turn-helix domain-containing protein n=1 Tax=Micromonospora sp. NPDC023633 TaxID=3154320 RepID=UPI003403F8B6
MATRHELWLADPTAAGDGRARVDRWEQVPAMARLVQADEDTIRQVIHRFNEMGMASLDPQWARTTPTTPR